MIKINSFKIQGFYENNNTYLEFKTDEDNYLLKLSKNYEYLANIYKKWDVQYSSSLSRNNRKGGNKKHPHELYRFQEITKDFINLLISDDGPLNQIIQIFNKFDDYLLVHDDTIVDSKLYRNIIDEKPKIRETKIIQEIIKISDLILPKFDKNGNQVQSKNLSAFIMSRQQDFILTSKVEEKLKKRIWNKASERIPQNKEKKNLDDFQKILVIEEFQNKLAFSLDTEEGEQRAKTIKKELSELFNSIQNIEGIYYLFKDSLENSEDKKVIFSVPYPKVKDASGKPNNDIRYFGRKNEGQISQQFTEYDTEYLKANRQFIDLQYENQPVVFETFSEVLSVDDNSATIFYLPNNEIDLNNLQLYLELVKSDLKYRKKSDLMTEYLRNEKQYNYAFYTSGFKSNVQYSVIEQRKHDADAEKATNEKFKNLLEIKRNIETNYSSFNLLSLNDLVNITNNYLNIFKSEDLVKNYIRFIKEHKKKNKEDEKESKSEDEFKSNLENFMKLLNKLNLRKFKWHKEYNIPLTFTSPYFKFKEFVLIDGDNRSYNFQVNLNLQELILNNYVRYLINFISNDQEISNTKDYEYDIKENVPDSTENNILLPPFLSEIKDKKDCCFILIPKNELKKFNDKNPTITNKSIFTNAQYLDSLLGEIFKYNSGESDSRLTDEGAFKKNLNLLNEIYFSPHPLQNPLIKHFHKNNTVKVKGKEYTILNLKTSNIPDIKKFTHKESQKDGKKVSERLYTVNLTLTVLPSDVSHNFITEIEASCPDKKEKLVEKYKKYIDKNPLLEGLKDIYKPKFVPTTWKIQDGKLKKKGLIEGGKTQKIYKYCNKRNKTHHQKNKKKKEKFTYKLHKFKKTFKKN